MTALSQVVREDFLVNRPFLDRTTLVVFRLNQAAWRSRCRYFVYPLTRVLDLVWVKILVGAELPAQIRCGPRLKLPHAGRGVIINSRSEIGTAVTIFHHVTIGQRGPDPNDVPTIGNEVFIGVGATIIGKVAIGDRASIGAGAIVVHDVPPGGRAYGPAAKIVDGSGGPVL